MPIPCSCAAFALVVCRTQEPNVAVPYVPRIEPASDEAAQVIQGFAPAKGIQVELFAAEPRLANPVSFCVDPGGTVYVAEQTSPRRKVVLGPGCRLVLLARAK